ncbi:hypothetical protein [Bacillus sp. 165]|nr:hypothetical protein [Bacillus sp. 165]
MLAHGIIMLLIVVLCIAHFFDHNVAQSIKQAILNILEPDLEK